MRSRLFTLVSALSLALCVAVVAAWPRTLRICDEITYITTGGSSYNIGTGPAAVTFDMHQLSPPVAPEYRSYLYLWEPGWTRESIAWGRASTHVSWSPPADGFMGVRWESSSYQVNPPMYVTSVGVRRFRLAVPLWLGLVVFAVLPVVWIFRWFRGRSQGREGLCAVCGYDLRASSGRCPECGNLIEQRAGVGPLSQPGLEDAGRSL